MRRRVGLSQRELAARTGIAQPNISAYESGRLAPNPATLARIETATRVPPSELVATLRAEIVDMAARYHASNVRVFGSAATGTDTTGSDLDLLVHFDDDASLYDQIGLTQDLESLLGIDVDIISDGASGAERIQDVAAL